MEKKLGVVLIAVEDFSDGRKAAERIQEQTFSDYHELFESVCENGIPVIKKSDAEVRVYRMTDFMDECNNQEIELEQFWVSYVYLTDKNFR